MTTTDNPTMTFPGRARHMLDVAIAARDSQAKRAADLDLVTAAQHGILLELAESEEMVLLYSIAASQDEIQFVRMVAVRLAAWITSVDPWALAAQDAQRNAARDVLLQMRPVMSDEAKLALVSAL